MTAEFEVGLLDLRLYYYYFYIPGSIDPRVKNKKNTKTNVEWLEVRIVVQNECLAIESCTEALNGDWEPLENERYFASVTRLLLLLFFYPR